MALRFLRKIVIPATTAFYQYLPSQSQPTLPVVPHQIDEGMLELPLLLQSLSTGSDALVSNNEEDVDLDSDEGCGIMIPLGDGLLYDLGAQKIINSNIFEEVVEGSLLDSRPTVAANDPQATSPLRSIKL